LVNCYGTINDEVDTQLAKMIPLDYRPLEAA